MTAPSVFSPQRIGAAIRASLPALCLLATLLAIWGLNPRAITYFGLNLMLSLAIPIALATLAQMFVMTGEDLDLSIGSFISFVGCIAATILHDSPLIGGLILFGAILIYAMLGAVIYWRALPSIVMTLGMSFVWQGLAILVLPTPGGKAPDWLLALLRVKTPVVPFPIVAACLFALIAAFILMRSSYGTILRGTGGNAVSVARAGWSLPCAKMTLYALAGCCGVLAGLAAVGLTTSADANFGNGYTLLTIVGVILGGGEFSGGRVSPVGAVMGALTLTLIGSLLNFMHITPDWQIGAQGVILIAVLALRLLTSRTKTRA